ncbi:hypothetical protein TREES_T100017242 [Tupaia chinensis]|uniref:Uncharacterized protein n=1 Tax=Tupaia chinensis TaxID=246437 RepID=L9JYM9_TUPCH|nr:hypothetical protein TREES_T100017242 [Tupaia chinensis]
MAKDDHGGIIPKLHLTGNCVLVQYATHPPVVRCHRLTPGRRRPRWAVSSSGAGQVLHHTRVLPEPTEELEQNVESGEWAIPAVCQPLDCPAVDAALRLHDICFVTPVFLGEEKRKHKKKHLVESPNSYLTV